jgi:hypothetical protein
MLAIHERADISELVTYLKSNEPLSGKDRSMLADLLDLLHAKSRKRGRGRPSHNGAAFNNNAQHAAYVAERFRQQWRIENGKRRVPEAITEQFCRAAIDDLEKGSGGKKSASLDNVMDIVLRGKLRIR